MQLLTTTHWSSGGHGRNGPSLAANSNPHSPNISQTEILCITASRISFLPQRSFSHSITNQTLQQSLRSELPPQRLLNPPWSIIPQLYSTENVTHPCQDRFSHTSSVCNRLQSRVYPNRQITNKHYNPQQRTSNQYSRNWLGFPFGRAGGPNISR